MTYAFTFDAGACSGCKACQEACKDKNGLPVGVLWRRVIEVSGGDWRREGDHWENSVFAYNLSLACSHCTYPKCAGVCPTDAYSVRPDGIVLLDSSRCMGCGYCAWACPYGAPQYDSGRGVMTKCNFCYDSLDSGQKPACVAACPLRVLELEPVEARETPNPFKDLWRTPAEEYPFPLPQDTHTEPHLAVKFHPGMTSPPAKKIANREEIQPARPGKLLHNQALDELPLVFFTLLTQMAVGMSICLLALPQVPIGLLLDLGMLFGLGGLASFLHLGHKRNAWRALAHLRKSWLSREVLLSGLFVASWLPTLGLKVIHRPTLTTWLMGLIGGLLIYAMAQIYRLKTIPAWNSWRTLASFGLSGLVLGCLAVNLFSPAVLWMLLGGTALLAELVLALGNDSFSEAVARRLRIGLLGMAIVATILQVLFPSIRGIQAGLPAFLLALAEETLERVQFYNKPHLRLL